MLGGCSIRTIAWTYYSKVIVSGFSRRYLWSWFGSYMGALLAILNDNGGFPRIALVLIVLEINHSGIIRVGGGSFLWPAKYPNKWQTLLVVQSL